MSRGRILLPGLRIVAGFALAMILFELLLGPYTGCVTFCVERTIGLWEPDDLEVHSVKNDGERILTHYSSRRADTGGDGDRVRLPESFFWIDAGTVVWDFLILITLFAGFACGPRLKIARNLLIALAILSAMHVVTFGLVIRLGYVPEKELYEFELATDARIRQILPVLLWILLCPKSLSLSLTRRSTSPRDPAP